MRRRRPRRAGSQPGSVDRRGQVGSRSRGLSRRQRMAGLLHRFEAGVTRGSTVFYSEQTPGDIDRPVLLSASCATWTNKLAPGTSKSVAHRQAVKRRSALLLAAVARSNTGSMIRQGFHPREAVAGPPFQHRRHHAANLRRTQRSRFNILNEPSACSPASTGAVPRHQPNQQKNRPPRGVQPWPADRRTLKPSRPGWWAALMCWEGLGLVLERERTLWVGALVSSERLPVVCGPAPGGRWCR